MIKHSESALFKQSFLRKYQTNRYAVFNMLLYIKLYVYSDKVSQRLQRSSKLHVAEKNPPLRTSRINNTPSDIMTTLLSIFSIGFRQVARIPSPQTIDRETIIEN